MVSTTMVDQGPHDMKQIHGRAGRMIEGVAPTTTAGATGGPAAAGTTATTAAGTTGATTPADATSLQQANADNDEG